MIELQDRHVVVVGLGESGLAMACWAAFKGARVSVLDNREDPPQREALKSQCPQATLVCGEFTPRSLQGADLLAWSPGLSPLTGPAASLFRDAQAADTPVLGELDFFADELARRAQQGYRPKVLAITGTNGKTTVTQLVGHLAAEAGIDVQMAGNISPAMLQALRERIEADRLPELWALELSSFQLALAGHGAAEPLLCTASTVLNVSQDHLDWHGTMAHYRESKLRIHRGSACCIVNGDDRESAARPAKVAPVCPVKASFSLSTPVSAPAFGLVRDGGLNWLVEAVPDDDAGTRRRRVAAATSFHLNRLMPVDALRLHGAHNQANVLAALALLRAAGVAMAPMLRGLQDFASAPHRCQLVAVVNEVEYYDDSKGTNVGATVAALSGLGKRCVLIAGGIGKGQDFTPLAAVVRRHARAVVLIGRDAPAIREALKDTGVALLDADSMAAAVAIASQRALAGDAVLMSPACASFDMFRNYPHRSEVFNAEVRQLAQEAGQPC